MSKNVRYSEDFDVPTQPFESDGETFVIMHLDGDLTAKGAGAAGEAKWVNGRMK